MAGQPNDKKTQSKIIKQANHNFRYLYPSNCYLNLTDSAD